VKKISLFTKIFSAQHHLRGRSPIFSLRNCSHDGRIDNEELGMTMNFTIPHIPLITVFVVIHHSTTRPVNNTIPTTVAQINPADSLAALWSVADIPSLEAVAAYGPDHCSVVFARMYDRRRSE
jgi:hypothetical protein